MNIIFFEYWGHDAMKIDSSIAVAVATAQQYVRQHEVYMAQVTQRVYNQEDENENGDFTLAVQFGEPKQQKHSAIFQDNTSVLMIDTALNTLTTSLLSMRDSLLQAITEAKDTQKTNTASDSLSKSEGLSSQRGIDVINNHKTSEDDSLDTGHAALSNINAALQQISKSRTVLHNMHLQTTISSSLSPSAITNGTAAKERSEQTKAQILDGANKSMQSQSNQNSISLYSIL